jgi:hypothetical protein
LVKAVLRLGAALGREKGNTVGHRMFGYAAKEKSWAHSD